MKGISYWLRNKLYISLTNECNSLSPIALRGPSFIMPPSSGFVPLIENKEPTPLEIAAVVDDAFENDKIFVSSMESDEITFAGVGEPLLRYNVLLDSANLIKTKRHGVPLRLKTNGLINSNECVKVHVNISYFLYRF